MVSIRSVAAYLQRRTKTACARGRHDDEVRHQDHGWELRRCRRCGRVEEAIFPGAGEQPLEWIAATEAKWREANPPAPGSDGGAA